MKKELPKRARRSRRIKALNNDWSSGPSGRRTCSFKCCFPGCSSTNMDLDKRWHKVPNDAKFPKTDSLTQVRNWNVKKNVDLLYWIG